MSASKAKNGTWTSRFYVTDQNGIKTQTYKRGFKTKKAALEYELAVLTSPRVDKNTNTASTFADMCNLYLDDISCRVKASTANLRKVVLTQRIIPYFKTSKFSEISPSDIRTFQNLLLRDTNYSQTYLRLINSTLTAVFNYAVKFHDLSYNPVSKAGTIGKLRTEISIWTIDDFKRVSAEAEERFDIYTILNLLFYTGMRIGELLALEYGDIDFKKKTIKINKTLSRINSEDLITPPKTESSNRDIMINDSLLEILKIYTRKIYALKMETRLFTLHQTNIRKQIKKFALRVDVKEIRIHDLRHSHASLLIHLGVNPLAISKRLGHEKVDTTLNVYSHLYPDSSEKIIALLEEL
ncbi:MAG: tyrosine-type recombinase/integrase [Cetobacterium sp.]|uniref:site-specific integrase n=1 Tax=Cetobacterium sp. TaxID=2071632 RepID=UPI003F3B9B6D